MAARKLQYGVLIATDTMQIKMLACTLFMTFNYLCSTDKETFSAILKKPMR